MASGEITTPTSASNLSILCPQEDVVAQLTLICTYFCMLNFNCLGKSRLQEHKHVYSGPWVLPMVTNVVIVALVITLYLSQLP